MSFFRQLGRGVKKFFGRQLPQGAAKFGRQLSNTSMKVGNALDKGARFVSKLERATGGVPIVGDVFGLASKGLSVGKNIADIGVAGGQGISALSRGDLNGAYQAGRTVYNEARDTGRIGTAALGQAAPLMAFL